MIIFQNVSKHFGVGEPALVDVSFTIDEGEFVFVTGHSGAGKTTIARLLTKEYEPTEGSIEFFGEDVNAIPRSRVHHHRRRIGVVYQDYKLLNDLTVFENIALALQIIGKNRDEINQRVTDLLELVQLPEKVDLFPSQLSGGEAQRVSIARALATAPSVLFADEPTGNLDQKTANHIMNILQKINQIGTTVIMSTHNDHFLKDTEYRVLILEKGKVTEKNGKAKKTKSKSEPKAKTTQDKPSKSTAENPQIEMDIELPQPKLEEPKDE